MSKISALLLKQPRVTAEQFTINLKTPEEMVYVWPRFNQLLKYRLRYVRAVKQQSREYKDLRNNDRNKSIHQLLLHSCNWH